MIYKNSWVEGFLVSIFYISALIIFIFMGWFFWTYEPICLESKKIIFLEQAAGTRNTVYYIYKLNDGRRIESDILYQNGQSYCLQKGVKKR